MGRKGADEEVTAGSLPLYIVCLVIVIVIIVIVITVITIMLVTMVTMVMMVMMVMMVSGSMEEYKCRLTGGSRRRRQADPEPLTGLNLMNSLRIREIQLRAEEKYLLVIQEKYNFHYIHRMLGDECWKDCMI